MQHLRLIEIRVIRTVLRRADVSPVASHRRRRVLHREGVALLLGEAVAADVAVADKRGFE